MKALLIFLTGIALSSCVHTAIAPIANPAGVPVVIRVPGVKAGQAIKKEKVAAIDDKISRELGGKSADGKPDPAIIAIGTVGKYGEVTTKRGEKLPVYLPLIVLRSTYPPEMVDRAAGQLAAAYYRSARKHYQVIPVTELKDQPKTNKP